MPPDMLDPLDLGPRLRAHAALLRDLRDDHLAVLPPDAIEALTLLGRHGHPAWRGESPPGMPEDAAHGVLRLMQRPTGFPAAPRPAAEVLPFRRATAAVPVLFAHETIEGDAS